MSHKTPKIAELIQSFQGKTLEAHYLGYFECFNRQQFFEAHEVLEELWLPIRKGPAGNFYKGLIQLAGAFVHLQKHRPGPARALLDLAEGNLRPFAPMHMNLDLHTVFNLIGRWRERAATWDATTDTLNRENAPKLQLSA